MTFRTAWLILVACLAVSLVVGAMAALNTALPGIAAHTHATNTQMNWILDGYTLVLAAFLLPAGAIGDRFGRREVLMIGVVVFGLASLGPIWFDSPTELIASRLISGFGAALIMPATLSLITSGVPHSKRALGVSIWASIAGVGAIIGFLVTGTLLEFFTWKSVFVTFALASAGVLVLALTIGSSKDAHPGRFDLLGSITSVLAVAGVVFGLLEAPIRGWSDPLVLIGLIGGVALAVAYVCTELRVSDPLLNVRLFRNRAFASGSLSVAMQFLATFGLFYLLLQLLQLVYGYSPLKSAFALGPMILCTGIFALLGNWIAVRFNALRLMIGGGLLIAAAGVLIIGTVDADHYWKLAVMLVICASGVGLATSPSTTAIMSNTPLNNQGVGSAVNDTARELGAAIGIALAGSIMAAGYEQRIGPTAGAVREQLGAAGDPAAAARAADGVEGSLAGATQVAAELRESAHADPAVPAQVTDQLTGLAARIQAEAQGAFLPPMQNAAVVLGCILLAGALFLAWYTPMQVFSPDSEFAQTDVDAAPPDQTGPNDTAPGAPRAETASDDGPVPSAHGARHHRRP